MDSRINRSVHFDGSVKISDIPNVSDNEKPDAIWYSSDEILLMRLSASDDIREEEKLRDYCIDVDASAQSKQERRQEAISNVILQQQLLWEDGVEDPELIAEIYTEVTGTSQLEATRRGILHATHITDVLRKEKASVNLRSDGSTRVQTRLMVSLTSPILV